MDRKMQSMCFLGGGPQKLDDRFWQESSGQAHSSKQRMDKSLSQPLKLVVLCKVGTILVVLVLVPGAGRVVRGLG